MAIDVAETEWTTTIYDCIRKPFGEVVVCLERDGTIDRDLIAVFLSFTEYVQMANGCV